MMLRLFGGQMLRYFLIVVLLLVSFSMADGQGTIAFMRDNAVFVSDAKSNDSRRVPNSEGAFIDSISPGGEYLVFFTGSSQNPRGYFCQTPFSKCQPLKVPSKVVYGLIWAGSGNRFFLGQQSASVLVSLPKMEFKAYSFFPTSISADGQVLAYATNSEIRVENAGKLRTVFAIPKLEKPLDWAFGGITLSRDGRQLYFASNSGAGIARTGTTHWRWFVVNTAGGETKPLELPEFTGRLPDTVEISSDGKKMVFGFSNQNATTIYLLNFVQNELRTLFQNPNGSLNAMFSPDSRYLAIGSNTFENGKFISRVDITNLNGIVQRSISGASQCTW
jgi:WD40 repeat protein